MILLEQRVIQSNEDMDTIERCVTQQLGCENHRCAFFRTGAYVSFRIAALYREPADECLSVFYERLCLKLERRGSGKVVSVMLVDNMVFYGDCVEQYRDSDSVSKSNSKVKTKCSKRKFIEEQEEGA